MRITPKFLLMLVGFGLAIGVAQTPPARAFQDDKVKSEMEKAASKLFGQASKQYKDKEYAQSVIDLIVLVEFYPEYTKIDQAVFQLGSALYEMGLYEAADQQFRYLLQSSPKTDRVPDAILGLQKVCYQKMEYQQSLKFYKALEAHYSAHASIDEARYYAIQAYYHLKNYNVVSNLVQHIKTSSEVYPFGLYTEALTYLKKKVYVRRSPISSKSAGVLAKPNNAVI
jgi:tetratricopeptide (TPR) repeat protein